MNVNTAKNAFLLTATLILSLLTICAVQAAPALASNGKIAFTSDRDGNSEIYLMNADGTGQLRLTNSPQSEDYPTWSPDGRRIAFLRQSGGVFSINLMNADGTNQTELTRIIPNNIQPYPYERFGMSWSPDGAKIAFQDSTDIFAINIDGSNRVNLTGGQFVNYEPTWSPDGARIAFARSIYSHGFYPEVYAMNANGSDIRRITTSEEYCESRSPDWSPDGGRLALSDCTDINPLSISLVNPDGTNLQRIRNDAGGLDNIMPKWSPDGTKIVFYRNGYPHPNTNIWVMNRDGSHLTQLTEINPNNFHPDWQPLVVNVANIEELYAAVNNPTNAGMQIVIASGVYSLSVNDPTGAARPNGGRLELQQNMSLLGVTGDRSAVVIDAVNLPAASYTTPLPNTGAIRMGKGTNAVEWMTVRNAINGGANIIAHLSAPGTANVRIAHVAAINSQRGIDLRNIAASTTGYVLQADIIDNDLSNNIAGSGPGIRIVNIQGVAGTVLSATLSGNRSFNNFHGIIIENTGSTNNGLISVNSTGDRFYENGLGGIVGGGLGTTNGNITNFTAQGTTFENNNGTNPFGLGGLIVLGAENTTTANGSSNNTANIELRNCRFTNNQLSDLTAIGARSNPVSVGTPGTNNVVNLYLRGITPKFRVESFADSIPDFPAGMNRVIFTGIKQ